MEIRKKIFTALVFLMAFALNTRAQTKIFTADIDNFWTAYDSVLKVKDTTVQKRIIQELYLDNATAGLKIFMELRNHSAAKHLKNILRYPKFWVSLRPHTLQIKNHTAEIQVLLDRFRDIYPKFKQPDIYFTIGCLNSGGTTLNNQVLIGAEIGVADKTVNASELSDWLQQVFKVSKDVVYLAVHEVVHTQQKIENSSADLLTNCIQEGAADFITEVLMQMPLKTPYITYGLANEKILWEKFRTKMYGTEMKDWLYNGSNVTHADLGYFMGYAICKAFYDKTADKKKAVAEILSLKYGDKKMINKFLTKSAYADKWN
jgi:hypothetical protein